MIKKPRKPWLFSLLFCVFPRKNPCKFRRAGVKSYQNMNWAPFALQKAMAFSVSLGKQKMKCRFEFQSGKRKKINVVRGLDEYIKK